MTEGFGEQIGVAVATTTITEYGIIRPDMLEVVPVFKKFQQPQTVTALVGDEASMRDAIKQIAGKSSYVAIYKGEQVTLTKLITQDGKPVLDRQLEMKKRAVTIQIS